MYARLAWALLAIGCGATTVAAPPLPPARPIAIEPPSEPTGIPAGYVDMHPVEIVTLPEGAALLVEAEGSHLVIPIFIGGTEGTSIAFRLGNRKPPRPLTHDLLDSVVRQLHGTIVKVQIDALHDDIYFGSIFVSEGHRVVRIDARPSDAIALSLPIGSHIPLYVARAVLDQAGVDRDIIRQRLIGPPGPTT